MIWVSPAQNFSKPPPVPDSPTVIWTPAFSPWKASAAAWVSGPTVLDPSMAIVPERSPATARRRWCRRVVAAGREAERESGRGGDRRNPL